MAMAAQTSSIEGWLSPFVANGGEGLLLSLAAGSLFLLLVGAGLWHSKRKAIKQLAASEARFRALAEASPLGMAAFDPATREMIWSNERYNKLHKDGLSKILDGQAWMDMALSESSPVVSFARDFDREGGKPGAARVHTARVNDDDGKKMLVALVEDSTASRIAKLNAESSLRKFEFIFKLTPLPMAIFERLSGRVMEVNQSFCELFGKKPQDWAGKTMAGAGLFGDGFEAARIWDDMVGNRGLHRREALMNGSTGEKLCCEMSASEMDWGQSPCFAMCVVDLTVQRQAEAEVRALNSELEERARSRGEQLAKAREDLARQERLASLGALVAGVAHELNTPIGNGLTVSTALRAKTKALGELAAQGRMRKEDLSSYLNEAVECAELIERNMGAASDFVSSFKQVSVDQMSSKRRKFDLAKCARDNCAALYPSMRKAKISLVLDVEEGVELDSYPGALGQVLVNLINNAVIHAFDGQGGRIEVGGARVDEYSVRIWVKDDGKGISDEDSKRVFDPFYSTRFGQGGSGLGLSIVYNLARDALGGQVELEKTAKGALFSLVIPSCAP